MNNTNSPEEPLTDRIDRIERFRVAANEAAQLSRRVYLTFLLLSVYVVVLVGSTTHEQLLKGTAAKLPIIDVELSIVGIYLITPFIYLLFHLNLLIQFYLLSQKLQSLDDEIEKLTDNQTKKKERSLLYSFPFSHMLVGRQHGVTVRALLGIMVKSTVLVLPLIVLLAVQLRFIPYHDGLITWIHRFAVLLNLIILWLMWPRIITPTSKWRDFWKLPHKGSKKWVIRGIRLWVSLVFLLTLITALSCLFVLVIPDEWIEIKIYKISKQSVSILESKGPSDIENIFENLKKYHFIKYLESTTFSDSVINMVREASFSKNKDLSYLKQRGLTDNIIKDLEGKKMR